MFTEHVEFEYEMPSGDIVLVEAKVTAGRPMIYPDLNHPGEPAEGTEVEIIKCYAKTTDGVPIRLNPYDRQSPYNSEAAAMEELACEIYEEFK